MDKVIPFPTAKERRKIKAREAASQKARTQQYLETLSQISGTLFDTADDFDVDIKDLMSDLYYVVVATDLQIGRPD